MSKHMSGARNFTLMRFPAWLETHPWETLHEEVSPNDFEFGALKEQLHDLVTGGKPNIRSRKSFPTVAYLRLAGGRLMWQVAPLDPDTALDRQEAYAWVDVSMPIGHRFLLRAYAAERALQCKAATMALDEHDRERCEKSAYLWFVDTRKARWVSEAQTRAMRWRPSAAQYELPAPIRLDAADLPVG